MAQCRCLGVDARDSVNEGTFQNVLSRCWTLFIYVSNTISGGKRTKDVANGFRKVGLGSFSLPPHSLLVLWQCLARHSGYLLRASRGVRLTDESMSETARSFNMIRMKNGIVQRTIRIRGTTDSLIRYNVGNINYIVLDFQFPMYKIHAWRISTSTDAGSYADAEATTFQQWERISIKQYLVV